MTNFYNLTYSDLQQRLAHAGQAGFRAQQIFKWVYEQGHSNFHNMSNLSQSLRQHLQQELCFELPRLVRRNISRDGTVKFVFEAEHPTKKLLWEAVAIPEKNRTTLCVSSQVGCNMACTFCFTGLQKLQHRLSTGQIVGQYLVARSQLTRPITSVVFMGMGEPLDNCEAVFKAIEILTRDGGLKLSRKKITLSTSGLVDRIPLVTQSGVYLAVSLNATTNTLRSQLMPINKKWPIEQLLQACHQHCQASGHKVTFEYVLLKGVTDSIEQAHELHQLTAPLPCKINLIPFNPHPGSFFKRPLPAQVQQFQKVLMQKGQQVYVRKTKGEDISAACGQLNPSH